MPNPFVRLGVTSNSRLWAAANCSGVVFTLSREVRHGKLGAWVSPSASPHKLSRLEARRRIETGFAKILRQVPGGIGTCSERWEGDRLIFEVGAMGQTISGVVDVLDNAVTMQIELPGMLGLLAGALKNRLQSAGQLLLK